MTTDSIIQYLDILKSAFSERASSAEIFQSDEDPVLLCTVTSPFDENDEIAYQISLNNVDDGFVAAELIMLLFGDISEDKHRDIALLINRLNRFISLGSFRLFEDNGTVMFYQGMIIDETMQTVKVTELIFRTIHEMEQTAVSLGEFIDRAISGEDTQKLLAELQRRLNDEQDI